MTRDEAEEICKENGGFLANIKSDEERWKIEEHYLKYETGQPKSYLGTRIIFERHLGLNLIMGIMKMNNCQALCPVSVSCVLSLCVSLRTQTDTIMGVPIYCLTLTTMSNSKDVVQLCRIHHWNFLFKPYSFPLVTHRVSSKL